MQLHPYLFMDVTSPMLRILRGTRTFDALMAVRTYAG